MAVKICRIGDIGIGICIQHSSPVVYITTFVTGSPTTTDYDLPVVRIGDLGVTSCGHITVALTGSSTLTADEIPVHRVGDLGTAPSIYHAVTGSPTTDNVG